MDNRKPSLDSNEFGFKNLQQDFVSSLVRGTLARLPTPTPGGPPGPSFWAFSPPWSVCICSVMFQAPDLLSP